MNHEWWIKRNVWAIGLNCTVFEITKEPNRLCMALDSAWRSEREVKRDWRERGKKTFVPRQMTTISKWNIASEKKSIQSEVVCASSNIWGLFSAHSFSLSISIGRISFHARLQRWSKIKGWNRCRRKLYASNRLVRVQSVMHGKWNGKKADHKYLMEKHSDTNDGEKGKKFETIKREHENEAGKRSTKKKKKKKLNWTSEMKFSQKKSRIYIRVVCVCFFLIWTTFKYLNRC